MSQLGTVYATKRRRRNGKSLKPPPKDGVTKSNPSKRHRERLNAELDLLASLLPFEQNILSKLDRLSILRLSVSYLRTKSYFQVVMHKDKDENGVLSHIHTHDGYRSREFGSFEHSLLDGDMFLQALNGFLMILTCEGEVFFATHSIESYLGFHQSDIVHQSVYELVHSEDREELQRQLLWNSFLPPDVAGIQLSDALAPDKTAFLERSFTVRFRCLLDNTSGFLRLDIRGRVKVLHGQNRKTEEPPLALFAYCTPFGPPSLLEIPQKENMFKSKHKLDLSLVSMDPRGKMVLGFSDAELANMGGYDLVHYDDLGYVASAHQELLKTGASGMIAYRFQKKDGEWQWLQTSSRLVYKNSKPDFVICTHRQLMEEEGRDLLGKRTMDFKVSYLDTGLASTYFTEADQLVIPPTTSPSTLPPPVQPQKTNRRYKTQLRDFLSTCRSKRKLQQQTPMGQVTPPAPAVEYISEPSVAVAAAYTNLNPMYTPSPYAPTADNIYMSSSVHSTNFYPVSDNLFHQYRIQGVGGYYPEYHHNATPNTYVANGFLPYDSYGITTSKDEKWQDTGKYYSSSEVSNRSIYSSGYASTTSPQMLQASLKSAKDSPPPTMDGVSCSSGGPSPVNSVASIQLNATSTTPNISNSNLSNNASSNNTNLNNNNSNNNGGIMLNVTPKVESPTQQQTQQQQQQQQHYEHQRQTVLMWGTTSANGSNNNDNNNVGASSLVLGSTRSPNSTPTSNGMYTTPDNAETHHLKNNQIVMSPTLIEDRHSHHNNPHSQQQQQQNEYHRQHPTHNPHHRHAHHGNQHPHPVSLHNQNPHLKWNGNSKELITNVQVYPQHHDDNVEGTSITMYSQVPPTTQSLIHSGGHIVAAEHSLHHHSPPQGHLQITSPNNPQTIQQPGINNSCEVWSPATYSQYQYFTYHHAPQHANTQSSLGEHHHHHHHHQHNTTQSHCLSLSNGYMEHHHHHHHQHHATISPMSQLTQLSHTHPTRTQITRTGVLCCPSLR